MARAKPKAPATVERIDPEQGDDDVYLRVPKVGAYLREWNTIVTSARDLQEAAARLEAATRAERQFLIGLLRGKR